jgi:vacuolar-type H+-ATPase subunit I/STV1
MKRLLEKLRKNKLEFLESVSVVMIFIGIGLISLGLIFNALKIHKLDAYFAMFGSFLVFLFIFALIITIFLKE